MNVQETLTQIDHIMTEVDLELYEWQTAVDMMSFLGVNATFELWTDDVPPRVVTEEVLPQVAGRVLRVMHYENGEWGKVGTAIFSPKTNLVHTSLPNHMIRYLDSTIGPRATSGLQTKTHFTMHLDGSVTDNQTGKTIVQPYDPDENVPKFEGKRIYKDLEWSGRSPEELYKHYENHPFFRTKSEPDTHEER